MAYASIPLRWIMTFACPIPQPASPGKNGSSPVDELTLASRLASFLWSSVPDEQPLPAGQEDEELSLRKRLEQHRSDPSCAACHALLDPPGFALENYDAIGRWRDSENGQPIDASAGFDHYQSPTAPSG